MKKHLNLSIEVEVVDKIRKMNINVSDEVEKFLRKVVMTENEDIDGINLELLHIEINRLRNQKIKIDMQLQNKLKKLEELNEIKQKKEQENLEKEKKIMEKQEKCLKCGKKIQKTAKKYEFPAGILCYECFLSSTSDEIRGLDE